MHRRVVGAVAVVLFALVAVMVGIVTDLHDRFFPAGLGATSKVTIDISSSGMSDEEAFHRLGELSDRWRLGLVKITPDLSGDHSGKAYVRVGGSNHLPHRVDRFGGQPASKIHGPATLAHYFASGEYLVTGNQTHTARFKEWLTAHRIDNTWIDDSLSRTLSLVVRQASFGISLMAVIALLVALVLYWLLVKARGRALRVLAGVSTWRIQYEDLGSFLSILVCAGVLCDATAIVYIGFAQGWVFVPYYGSTVTAFDAIVVLVTLVCAVTMSFASWPNTNILARRIPVVTSLRRISMVLKAATFVLVLASVAPAVTAYGDAREAAARQAIWKSLSDQVVLRFNGALAGDEFKHIRGDVGKVVRVEDEQGDVGLSCAWTRENNPQLDLGPARNLAMVNQRWLDLVLPDGSPNTPDSGLVPLSEDEVPEAVEKYIGPDLALWTQHDLSEEEALSRFTFYRYSGENGLPIVLNGSGELTRLDSAIVMVTPKISTFFNDVFLAPTASTGNLLFTGMGRTVTLIGQHGLRRQVYVKHAAEEGILRAQVSAYVAWLKGISLVALMVALALSAVVGALITAMVKAHRDFPLRLAGKPWRDILGYRITAEWGTGVALTLMVLLARGLQDVAIVSAVAAVALLLSPLTHIAATRWNFTNISLRKL